MATALPRSPLVQRTAESSKKMGRLQAMAQTGASFAVAVVGIVSSVWLFLEAVGWSL